MYNESVVIICIEVMNRLNDDEMKLLNDSAKSVKEVMDVLDNLNLS